MSVLRTFIRFADTVNEKVGLATAWLTTLMVGVVCLDVILRELFKKSYVGLSELAWHLFALVFLLGAGYTLKHGRHVRVDIFYSRFSERKRRLVDLIGTVLFLLPFSVLVIVVSWGFVMHSFQMGETSPDPGGLPWRWLLKAAIPAGFVLLLIQGLAEAIRALIGLRGETLSSEEAA